MLADVVTLALVSLLPDRLPEHLYHFALSPAMRESCCCWTSSPAFAVVNVLDFSRSNGRLVILLHCCFNLQFAAP